MGLIVDVEKAVSCMGINQFAPIFEISSVTGVGLDLLRDFIKRLTVKHSASVEKQDKVHADLASSKCFDNSKSNEVDHSKLPSEFYLDDVYLVQGVGIVVGGTLTRGKKLSVNDKLLIGPDKSGYYRQVVLKSIHRQCVPSNSVFHGQHATLAIKQLGRNKDALKRTQFRKGMVVVADGEFKLLQTNTVLEFEAIVKVLHHSTTISPGYSPVVHLGVVRQAAQIVSIKNKAGEDCTARTGNEVIVRFRFLHNAEFLSIGRLLIFREGRAKGCGRVTQLFPSDPPLALKTQ